MSKRTGWLGWATACLVLTAGCGDQDTQQTAGPPSSVVAMKVEARDLRPSMDFTGRVVAVDEVELIARVQGFLQRRTFREGQVVKAGDLLFQIEKAPFEAEVQQREADLARAEAESRNAQLQYQRAQELLKSGNIPQSEADRRQAAYLSAVASVKQAQAALEAARINLGYTDITAPVSGRIGRSAFTEGALVGPSSGPLATLVSQDPIHVTFPVSQRQLLDFRQRSARQGGEGSQVVVRLRLANGQMYDQVGKVDFLDVQADPGTDTVTVRAEFPNPQGILVPGQFAGVEVEAGAPVSSITVPQAAIQVDQSGPYVLVVGEDRKATIRRLELRPGGGGGKAVVEKGLGPGDLVVVEGIQKVRPGQEVQVAEAPPASGAPR